MNIHIRTAIVVIACTFLNDGSAQAGPPLASDDAGTVDVGKVEIEMNGSYSHNKVTATGVTSKSCNSDAEIKITTGLYKNLGISLAIPYTVNQRVWEERQLIGKTGGINDITVELKYAFAELAGINFAIKPSAIVPTGRYSVGLSEGRWQFGTVLIATREFNDGKYALHANLGLEHHSYRADDTIISNRSNLWSGSIAGEVKPMKCLIIVADFGLSTTADTSTTELSAYALAGARYEINDYLDINAGVRMSLSRPEDDVSILYGLVLKF